MKRRRNVTSLGIPCTGNRIVDENGQPQQIRAVRSLSNAFDENAIQAVEKYRFEPGMLHGESTPKPVPVEVNIEINFRSK
jgi:periplasmic protein TonB